MQQEQCPLVRHRAVTKSGDDNKAEEARSDCKAANHPPESCSEALAGDAPPNQSLSPVKEGWAPWGSG